MTPATMTAPTVPSDPADDDPTLPWHLAATLAERAEGIPTEVDDERAERRLHQWRRLPALAVHADGHDEALDAELEPLGVTGARLRALLGETDASLRSRMSGEPGWHRRFATLWRAGRQRPSLPGDRHLDLLEFARPLIDGALEELRDRGEALVSAHDDATEREIARAALGSLVSQPPLEELAMTAGPTLVLELNVARVEGRLTAADTRARYEQFVAGLADPVRSLALCREYPVLARMLVTRLGYWQDRNLELLERLLADLGRLRDTLLADEEDPGKVIVAFGAGDSHRRGRSVAIVRFGTTRVVYKPRDPQVDVAFDAVLAWLNASGPTHQLRRPTMVVGDGYGWFEHIDTGIATDGEGARRFAHRLGMLTALLHGLHATDFHFENVLAAGDQPVLVDLEALLHVDKTPFADPADVVNPAATALGDSVLSVGVLPNRVVSGQGATSVAVDVSALGGHGGQQGLVEVPTFVEVGTDTMHIRSQRSEVPGQNNRPTGEDGAAFDLLQEEAAFAQGFREAYESMQHDGAAWTGPDGLLDGFAGTAVRHIARPTYLYGRLSLQAMHPDFQRDGLDQTMCLGKMLGGHRGNTARHRMVANEFADMLVGDVPVFAVEVASGHVVAGNAEEHIDTREHAPLELVARRIGGFDDADLALQLRVIELSFAAATIDGHKDRWPGWSGERPDQGIDADRLVTAAGSLGRQLVHSSFREDGRIGWLGLDFVDDRWWTLRPAATDLYGGLPGIAHALAAVGEVADDSAVREAALQAFDQVAATADGIADLVCTTNDTGKLATMSAGAFGYVGGSMYALAHAASRYQRPDLARAAELLIEPLARLASFDREHDVVAGRAGAILALLSVDRVLPESQALTTAVACAADLVAAGDRPEPGLRAWKSPADGQGLVGFSHGAAGIAFALDQLDRRLGRGDHATIVGEALAYERRHLSPGGDWEDLRADSANNRWGMRAWCHGAPGAAMVRDVLLGSPTAAIDPDQLRRERDLSIGAAGETGLFSRTLVTGIGNHSLCHGDVGNLLCLDRALPAGSDHAHHLETAWAALVEHGTTAGWLCGVPTGRETPGLMTGLAGIAWGLARRASADEPDLLLLEPPRRAIQAGA